MRKAKRTLLAAACACALVVGAVAGTVAYLTATTETVTNTFTVGNVEFDKSLNGGLDEAKVDEYGQKLGKDGKVYTGAEGQTLADRVAGNSYKLVPGNAYVKDPTVHMKTGSEPAWVFVKVTNGIAAYESTETGYQSIAAQIKGNGWTQLTDDDGDAVAGVYYKDWSETSSPSNLDLVVFGGFKIADGANSMSGWSSIGAANNVTVKAYAVQKDGFENALAAWTEAAKLDSSTPATPEDGE